MGKTILSYKSDPKIYAINCSDAPYRGVINDFSISEELVINKKYSEISKNLGDYQLIIETEVNDTTEMQSKYFEIEKIIQELDRSWVYACGHPLKSAIQFMGPYLNFHDGKISGWISNYIEAGKEINKGKRHAVFSAKTITYASFPFSPLKDALNVRSAYLVAQEPIVTLIDLHYFAHKAESSYSCFLFLAKAMELVQVLLPGKNDSQKDNKLPSEIKSKMKTSLHHIMGLANNRYEIRHIVKNKENCALHERMNNSEIYDYKHDADLLIRFIVCQELVIPYRKLEGIPQRA